MEPREISQRLVFALRGGHRIEQVGRFLGGQEVGHRQPGGAGRRQFGPVCRRLGLFFQEVAVGGENDWVVPQAGPVIVLVAETGRDDVGLFRGEGCQEFGLFGRVEHGGAGQDEVGSRRSVLLFEFGEQLAGCQGYDVYAHAGDLFVLLRQCGRLFDRQAGVYGYAADGAGVLAAGLAGEQGADKGGHDDNERKEKQR